jgi:hypothetical protein
MREALAARLRAVAAAGGTVGYGALARNFGVRVAEVTAALEALMVEDVAAGRPLLAAVCEGRLSQGLPAPGFFQAAAALGIGVDDPAAFTAQERARLRAMYQADG